MICKGLSEEIIFTIRENFSTSKTFYAVEIDIQNNQGKLFNILGTTEKWQMVAFDIFQKVLVRPLYSSFTLPLNARTFSSKARTFLGFLCMDREIGSRRKFFIQPFTKYVET